MVSQTLNNIIRNTRTELVWLFALLCIAVIPHTVRVPVWVPVMFFSLGLWKIFYEKNMKRFAFLKLLAKLSIAVLIVVGILISYGTLVGRDAGIALLILLSGMKFLETRNERDYFITSYISMFLVLTNFLYTQTILTALYMLIAVTVFVCTLLAYNDRKNFLNTGNRFIVAGSMVLQALPMMIVLFVLFPRVPGPVWGLPRDAHAGLAGIDDEMEPGSISQLVLSNEIAFRVKFDSEIPEQRLLYWRGPVLVKTDGVKWFRDKPKPDKAEISVTGNPVNYTVTLEPTDQNWLYGLEMPVQPPEESKFSNDMEIRTRKPVDTRKRYELSSHTDYRFGTGSPAALDSSLQLPAGYHEKAIDLGRSWRREGLGDPQIINRALQMFNEQEFYYTTTPPPLLQDIVDQFLFESRQGFCEHYAAAFTILMRAAGIPARVVTGYQGGTVNPYDGFLVLRQRDAHAWTEVWLQDRGWARVDPTSAVSPARIMSGITEALPEGVVDIPLGLQGNETARNFWLNIRNTVDAINNRWNQWVLSYDTRQQLVLFNRIGLGNFNPEAIGITLVLTILVIFTVVYLWMFKQRTENRDRARFYYDRFCNRLARLGIRRFSSEGPLDFASRATVRRRDLAERINHITHLYIDIRYGDEHHKLDLLEAQVKSFKPSSARSEA